MPDVILDMEVKNQETATDNLALHVIHAGSKEEILGAITGIFELVKGMPSDRFSMEIKINGFYKQD